MSKSASGGQPTCPSLPPAAPGFKCLLPAVPKANQTLAHPTLPSLYHPNATHLSLPDAEGSSPPSLPLLPPLAPWNPCKSLDDCSPLTQRPVSGWAEGSAQALPSWMAAPTLFQVGAHQKVSNSRALWSKEETLRIPERKKLCFFCFL